MSPKRIVAIAAWNSAQALACYQQFFALFNQGLFFEAHEVLEVLWLAERHGPEGPFFKGLIQLAGAFVHAQKRRFGPATALLALARSNLAHYQGLHLGLEVGSLLARLEGWRRELEQGQVPRKVEALICDL